MTYREILTRAEQILHGRGIDEAKNDAWLLFEYVFKMARHEYFMKMNDAIPEDGRLYDEYLSCIERRGQHVPLQHITGCQEFMGLNFFVNESVLIPRQDTEVLVEKALEKIELINTEKVKEHDIENIRFLDMCTGSGCIAVSLYSIARRHGMTGIEGMAAEITDPTPKLLRLIYQKMLLKWRRRMPKLIMLMTLNLFAVIFFRNLKKIQIVVLGQSMI